MERILEAAGDGYYEEKKSKFLATAYPVHSQEEVDGILLATRKKYYDARHHCYAYVLGGSNATVKSSDDGEPSGTAGKPILEVIKGANLSDCLVVVTRYFGGTLLGTGGLVRAYQKSAQDALAHAKMVTLVEACRVSIQTDYSNVGKMQRLIAEANATCEDTQYAADVTFFVQLQTQKLEAFCKEVTEATAGKAVWEKLEDCKMKLSVCYEQEE